MHIKVKKKHIKMGEPKLGKDPLSLAFQDALGLPERCVRVTPSCITLIDYSGSTRYSRKLPEEAGEFLKGYYAYLFVGGKKPKPFTFEIEPVDYFIEKVNLIKKIAKDIEDIYGDAS